MKVSFVFGGWRKEGREEDWEEERKRGWGGQEEDAAGIGMVVGMEDDGGEWKRGDGREERGWGGAEMCQGVVVACLGERSC